MMDWWQRRSLRFRLAAWYALGGTILLSLFSATVYLFVSDRLARPLDYQLQRDLAKVQAHLSVTGAGQVQWDNHEVRTDASWPPSRPWFELWDENGALVRRFWPFAESRLERTPAAPARGRDTISVFNVAPDLRLRVLSVPLAVPGREEAWMLRVMRIHEPATDALRALLLIIAVALPVVVVLLVVGGYALTRRWLKPLDQMVEEINRITAHDLSRRLPVANPHDELGQFATVFNVTLARLEDSFLALDRFVADASHELLTPLTTLRSVGEVGLRASRSPAEYREIIASMLEEGQRLQLLVEKLLQLARAEGGTKAVEFKKVRVDELARQCVEDAAVLAEDRAQRVELLAVPYETETDPLLLRQALQNLLDNAMKYSPPDALITVSVEKTAAGCDLSVRDAGPGFRDEEKLLLTDRFYRADPARGHTGSGGFGLGLAITKAYMRVLGGALDYEPVKPRGSVFRLSIPKA